MRQLYEERESHLQRKSFELRYSVSYLQYCQGLSGFLVFNLPSLLGFLRTVLVWFKVYLFRLLGLIWEDFRMIQEERQYEEREREREDEKISKFSKKYSERRRCYYENLKYIYIYNGSKNRIIKELKNVIFFFLLVIVCCELSQRLRLGKKKKATKLRWG